MIGHFAIRTHMLGANLVRLVKASASSVPFFAIRFRCKPCRTNCWLVLLLSSLIAGCAELRMSNRQWREKVRSCNSPLEKFVLVTR